MAEAFFIPEGGRYAATELTRGPWDPDSQHAGPPAALIGREIERAGTIPDAQVGRISFEILRPIPIVPLSVSVEVVRAGRTVELVEAVLSDEHGELIRARAWRIRTTKIGLPEGVAAEDGVPEGPDGIEPVKPFVTGHDASYFTAVEARFGKGHFTEPGPATAWLRMRHPLVAGEEPSPLARVLVAADSGNGVSGTLDFRRFVYINTDLTVNLLRPPQGEWICLDAVTHPRPHGVGLADTTLYDQSGLVGRATQTLVIDERRA